MKFMPNKEQKAEKELRSFQSEYKQREKELTKKIHKYLYEDLKDKDRINLGILTNKGIYGEKVIKKANKLYDELQHILLKYIGTSKPVITEINYNLFKIMEKDNKKADILGKNLKLLLEEAKSNYVAPVDDDNEME